MRAELTIRNEELRIQGSFSIRNSQLVITHRPPPIAQRLTQNSNPLPTFELATAAGKQFPSKVAQSAANSPVFQRNLLLRQDRQR